MRFVIIIFFTIIFSEVNELSDSGKVYEDLKLYRKSGKHFELVLTNEQVVYASDIVELNSLTLTVNILKDRRMGQSKSFESLVKEEIENNPPKLLRKINLVNIYAVHESTRTSVFSKIPYSPTTLIVIVPLILFFVKFISTMIVA